MQSKERHVEEESAQNALNQLNGQQIDLIITDWYMPDMDGIELIKKVRNYESYEYVPIMLLTGSIQSKDNLKIAKDAGVTGWLEKPFERKVLIDRIKKILR